MARYLCRRFHTSIYAGAFRLQLIPAVPRLTLPPGCCEGGHHGSSLCSCRYNPALVEAYARASYPSAGYTPPASYHLPPGLGFYPTPADAGLLYTALVSRLTHCIISLYYTHNVIMHCSVLLLHIYLEYEININNNNNINLYTYTNIIIVYID